MIKFTIGEPVDKEHHFDVFKIVVTFMHGDADAETKVPILLSPDKFQSLAHIILDYVEACNNDNGRHAGREPTLQKMIEESDISKEDGYELSDLLLQGDVTCDHQFIACAQAAVTTYFDNEGIERNVSFE